MNEREKLFDWIIEWTNRMCLKYDGICYEKNGLKWDWGQAITRAVYGPNWNNIMDDEPSVDILKKAVQIAKDWEVGNPPEWFKNE